MSDADYDRYVRINLPHARTIVARIGRSLEALGGASELHGAYQALELALRDFDDDPPLADAIVAADAAAERARALAEAILETPSRGDRLGQNVRNLFECLGLAEEGAALALRCGERPDSPLR